jgi:hypothetical protein
VLSKAGQAITSGGAKGSCESTSTKVALPAESTEQQKLLAVLAHIKYESSGVGGKPTIQFSGVNVQVVNGEGKTASANGEGNLVIGYDENEGKHEQAGSHYLVLGQEQTFTSYGGVLAGVGNTIRAPYASVSAGTGNTASEEFASVSGGEGNIATGRGSSVSGGAENRVVSTGDTVSGGRGNFAGDGAFTGLFASVSGGEANSASGSGASVSGGYANEASGGGASIEGGTDTSISGGAQNRAAAFAASVTGGYKNVAGPEYTPDSYASVSGGEGNTAYGQFSTVTGGQRNTAGGNYSAILGTKGKEILTEWGVWPKAP